MTKKTEETFEIVKVDDTNKTRIDSVTKSKPVETINYTITLDRKTLLVRNVPVDSNSVALQAQLIAIYGGLGKGKYTFDGTSIEVEIEDVD